MVDYDHASHPGKTWVRAVVYNKAWGPNPEDGASVENVDQDLSWMAGSGAVSHDVYFGTTNPPAFVQNQPASETTYDPGTLTLGQTYYWRIDEFDGSTTHTGDIWSFTVILPELAKSPDPADGATGVATQPLLSWTAGDGAVSHDVYFGESEGSLAAMSLGQADPNYQITDTLIKGKEYFWRIDEFDGTTTHTGLVWNFTVVAGASGTTWNNNDPSSELWSSESNWSSGVPGLATDVWLSNDPNTLIDATVTAAGKTVRFSTTHPVDANLPTFFMTGGTLDFSSSYVMGQDSGSKPVMEISGGTANYAEIWVGNMDCWNMGSGRLIVTGGEVNVGTLFVSRCGPTTGQEGAVQLDGGVINANSLYMAHGYMDIAGGTLIIDGDVTGDVNGYVTSGWITAYDGTGVLIVDYDNINPGKTTLKACPSTLQADFNADCTVDITDLEWMASDWLYQTPSQIAWEFDMSTDPVGPGDYDLELRNATDTNYNMTDIPGMLHVTGPLLLDEKIPSSGLWDADLHYIARAENETGFNLWLTMGTSTDPGSKAYVGVTITKVTATNTQTVEIWTGDPEPVAAGDPVVITGFDPDALIDITIAYDYETDTMDWTATDGTLSQSGNDVFYNSFNAGDGGGYTIQGVDGSAGYIDYLSFVIHGSDWHSAFDLQPDGVVDLVDFSVLGSEWLN